MSVSRRALPMALAAALGLSAMAPAAAAATPASSPAVASAPTQVDVSPATLRAWQAAMIKETNAARAAAKQKKLRPSNCLSKAGVPIAKRLSRSPKEGASFKLSSAEVRALARCAPKAATSPEDWHYGFVWGKGFRSPSAQMAAMRKNRQTMPVLRAPSFTQVGAATAVGRRGEVWGLILLVE